MNKNAQEQYTKSNRDLKQAVIQSGNLQQFVRGAASCLAAEYGQFAGSVGGGNGRCAT